MAAVKAMAAVLLAAVTGAVLYSQRERHHRAILSLAHAVWTRPLYPPDDDRPRLVLVGQPGD